MGRRRFEAPPARTFLVCVVGTAVVGGLVSYAFGEAVLGLVGRMPASASGFQVLGWVLAGPPALMAAMSWNDRSRLGTDQRKKRATTYGVWLGLGGLVVPALSGNAAEAFGDAASTANQLAFGWACGAVADVAAIAFAAGLGAVRRQAAPPGRGPVEGDPAARFVEVAWTVLLGVALLFAAYGEELGFVF